ncbi:MAG TPA: hypothetical protein PLS49_02120 [Candidatus Woesebacteria bacterium]|nr:hypothetical protein [Candidatus Woesebacteria bacterium]
MHYSEKEFNPILTESLYELKPPTCEKFEPNFLNVFDSIQAGYQVETDFINSNGIVVASIWENQEIFGFKKWISGNISNAAVLPIVVKNPYRLTDQEELIGIRNGLVCTA